MGSRLIQILLGLSLLLNTFVLVGFVYSSWISPPTFERHMLPPPPPPGTRPSPVELVIKDLGLDDAQRDAVRGQLDRYAAARRERFREIQKIRDQIAAELAKPQMDMTQIDGLIDQITKLRADQSKESLHAVAQLGPQLRPDQRERLHVLLVQRFAGAPPPRPPGPGGRAPGAPAPGPGRPPQ